VVVVLGASAVQCSSSSRDGYEAAPDAEAPPPQLVSPVDAADDAAVADDIDQECTGDNTQIYVLERYPDKIFRFDPASLTFTFLTRVECVGVSGVYSMAVDRRGVAWIVFSNGEFVNIGLSDGECKPILLKNRPPSFVRGGMGFSKDDSRSGEGLFVQNWPGADLFKIDPATRDVSRLGMTHLGAGHAELTGTGDGKLFSYFNGSGEVALLDKTTGASLETYRTSVLQFSAFAVAQWGGDFWIFGRHSPEGTKVYRYSPATDETTLMLETELNIVGAGSSTCAPFKPVQ